MQLQREKLQKILEKVKPGLANSEFIQQATSFAFLKGRVATYNDEISISCPITDIDFTGAISAEELYKFVVKAPKDKLNISKEDESIRVQSGRARAQLNLQKEISLPLDEVGDITDWKKLPDDFMEGLNFIHFSCSTDQAYPLLTCAHIPKNGILESCDNFRASRFHLSKKIPIEAFLIPINSIRELLKYKVTTICRTTGWVHFKCEDDVIFSCRIFLDSYPNLDKIMDLQSNTEFSFPDDLGEIISRAEIFVSNVEFLSEKQITISIEGRKLFVKSTSKFGKFEEWTKTDGTMGNDFTFLINPDFLRSILKKSNTCKINKKKIGFSKDNWLHVIALPVNKI